jgi:hypothetical protein
MPFRAAGPGWPAGHPRRKPGLWSITPSSQDRRSYFAVILPRRPNRLRGFEAFSSASKAGASRIALNAAVIVRSPWEPATPRVELKQVARPERPWPRRWCSGTAPRFAPHPLQKPAGQDRSINDARFRAARDTRRGPEWVFGGTPEAGWKQPICFGSTTGRSDINLRGGTIFAAPSCRFPCPLCGPDGAPRCRPLQQRDP